MRKKAFLILFVFTFICMVQASVLSDLAATMNGGEWKELSTNNFQGGNVLKTSDGGNILEYTDEAQWDPVGKKLYIMGTARGNCACYGTINQKWITYDEQTNTWTEMPRPSFYWGFHGYDHAALDPGRRHYYIRVVGSNNVHRYDIATSQWSQIPNIPTSYQACCSGLEYFPEMDRVVFSYPVDDEFHLYNPATNSWSSVIPWGYSVGNTIHNITEYDPVNGVLYFSGQNSSNDFFRLDSSGNVSRLASSPVPLGISGTCTQHTADPVSGKFLVYETDSIIYEYDPDANSWSQAGKHPLYNPIYSGRQQAVTAKIPEYGVNISVKWDGGNSKVYLYRHSDTSSAISYRDIDDGNDLGISVRPNPFNTAVKIEVRRYAYGVWRVSLQIYDISGKLVKDFTPYASRITPYAFTWSASQNLPGTYLIRLTAHNKTYTSKIVLMK